MKFPWFIVCIVAAVTVLVDGRVLKSDEPDKPVPSAADPMRGKTPGEVRDDNGLKLKLVWCPPGAFTMEEVVERVIEAPANNDNMPAPKPRPAKRITRMKVLVSQGYWLGKYEVTQSEWKEVMKTEPWKGRDLPKDGADFPATYVNWDDAMAFSRKLTEQERHAGRLPNGWEYALPTEAQWERACRARTETEFSFGNDESKLGQYAWFHGNARNAGEHYPHQVGQKKPNPWGLFDVHGNVAEWCRDIYRQKLPGGRDPDVQPDEKSEVSDRVIRGGGWHFDASRCRSAYRLGLPSDTRYFDLGFRVSLSPAK